MEWGGGGHSVAQIFCLEFQTRVDRMKVAPFLARVVTSDTEIESLRCLQSVFGDAVTSVGLWASPSSDLNCC
jgi:hypothetical protein